MTTEQLVPADADTKVVGAHNALLDEVVKAQHQREAEQAEKAKVADVKSAVLNEIEYAAKKREEEQAEKAKNAEVKHTVLDDIKSGAALKKFEELKAEKEHTKENKSHMQDELLHKVKKAE